MFKAMDSFYDARVDGDRGVAGVAFGSAPVTATTSLIYRDPVLMNIIPTEPHEFANPKPSINSDVDHRGIRLWDQGEKFIELRRSEVRLIAPATSSLRWQTDAFYRVLSEESVLNSRAQDA
jgi:hypothetical protein